MEKETTTKAEAENAEAKDKNATKAGKKKEKETRPAIYYVEQILKKLGLYRRNEVTDAIEQKSAGSNKFVPADEHSLHRVLQHRGLGFFRLNELISLLKSDFVPRYHPFKEYFKSLAVWDEKTDHINELGNFVKAEDQEFFNLMLKKWMVKCIICALDNIPNRTVFILAGKQEIGKSWYLRFLSPFGSDYFSEAPIRDNKDTDFRLTECFLISLEEMDDLTNVQLSKMKAMISRGSVKERKPYDRDELVKPRRASFAGSTNKVEFLTDTENTRWMVLKISDIDHSYRTSFNINLAWAQAFALYNSNYNAELTDAEKQKRNEISKDFEVSTPEKDALLFYTVPGDKIKFPNKFMTVYQILDMLHTRTTIEIGGIKGRESLNPFRLNKYELVKNLTALGYEKGRKMINGKQVRGYYIVETSTQQQIKDVPINTTNVLAAGNADLTDEPINFDLTKFLDDSLPRAENDFGDL